ncbi:phosphatidic acid phosphatase type 2/haloperoxidase [Triangularia verruculosa]|uniref:Phosphatidic acid phosphatase type 2/haloperoxidase n=1 Tax=Triangularia verruculosa TaxID=2587418 RepID=A0AAN7AUV3_9PEZI|nr:phosphatidic acid phosphatase type 2/haloperoxidase [Triangularia verruculosa]
MSSGLPKFYRRDRDRRRESRALDEAMANGTAGTTDATSPKPKGSKSSRLMQFIKMWILVSWKDIIAMAVFGAAALGIYQAPYASTRNFPITFTQSGDIVYPEFAYPHRGWIISPQLSGVVAAVIPLGVIFLAQIRIKSFWDLNNAVLGLLYSLILSSLFQVIIKMLIGGFRPYFLDVCQPDIALASTNNATGLNGVGFRQIMYTVEVCTNPDKQAIKTAMTSFPSGHATSAWAGYGFLFLWMNAKLKVWGNYQTSFYWLVLLTAPVLGATLMATCLTVDQAHHWYDILAGSIIGIGTSVACYRLVYAAVWDWRWNHVPLKRVKAFGYEMEGDRLLPGYHKATWTKKLGWGRKGRGRVGRGSVRGPVEKRAMTSGRSSETYARNGSAVSPHSRIPPPVNGYGNGVAHPAPAVGSHGRYDGRGDQMV